MLACPACGGELKADSQGLTCSKCLCSYEVEDGVPLMYASPVRPEAHRSVGRLTRLLHALVADSRVYDLVQRVFGYSRLAARIRDRLGRAEGVVLDVGAGTGAVAALVPKQARYVWLDYSSEMLAGFRSRYPDAPALVADARRIPLSDRSVDVVVTVLMTHHLDDEMLDRFLGEAARVTRGQLLLVDALRTSRIASRLLWKYDRGAVPRSLEGLRRAIEQHFTIDHAETFAVVHRYVLCTARPIEAGDRRSRRLGASPGGPHLELPDRPKAVG